MAFGKWNTSGELTWADGEVLNAADLNDSIDETTPPIGAVIAWMKSFTGVPATLPGGWVECDGSVISDADSPLNGETLPDLNGDNRFLSGSAASGVTGGADTMAHTHPITFQYFAEINAGNVGGAVNSAGNTSAATNTENRPPFYSTVWIMRIK